MATSDATPTAPVSNSFADVHKSTDNGMAWVARCVRCFSLYCLVAAVMPGAPMFLSVLAAALIYKNDARLVSMGTSVWHFFLAHVVLAYTWLKQEWQCAGCGTSHKLMNKNKKEAKKDKKKKSKKLATAFTDPVVADPAKAAAMMGKLTAQADAVEQYYNKLNKKNAKRESKASTYLEEVRVLRDQVKKLQEQQQQEPKK